ncbi:hypothetical protein HU200_065036 [Digitaria exilis]|uniref:Glycosyltransferase n=1 Tax=Digitaria exilis TaxID=1010633 RepID=A0A835DUW4_9POAL|nr:hypothetical protein HU200_065036 [Digitaria exilis]
MALADAAPCQARRHHGRELPHVAIFPLMAKGHTIPLLDLACLLLRRGLAAVTLFTTPGRNAAFVRGALAKAGAGDDDAAVVVELPFPDDGGHGAAAAAGSVEGVASASFYSAFIEATSLLRRRFEDALAAMSPRTSLLVADAFLYWAHASAAALGVVRELAMRDKPGATPTPRQDGHPGYDDDASTDTYTVPVSPHLRFKLSEFAAMSASDIELHAKASAAVVASQGVICLVRHHSPSVDDRAHAKLSWIRWLDEEADAGPIPEAQLKEVADGLDRASVDFLWAVRPSNADLGTGFEDLVEGRGKVVREWVDQWEILQHASVRGFLSHGGWNSVLESITAGVPMAVWPIEFEQPMNARFVVDELKVQTDLSPLRWLLWPSTRAVTWIGRSHVSNHRFPRLSITAFLGCSSALIRRGCWRSAGSPRAKRARRRKEGELLATAPQRSTMAPTLRLKGDPVPTYGEFVQM